MNCFYYESKFEIIFFFLEVGGGGGGEGWKDRPTDPNQFASSTSLKMGA